MSPLTAIPRRCHAHSQAVFLLFRAAESLGGSWVILGTLGSLRIGTPSGVNARMELLRKDLARPWKPGPEERGCGGVGRMGVESN